MDVGAFAAVGVGVFMVVWVGLGWCLVVGRDGGGEGEEWGRYWRRGEMWL